MDIFIDKNKNQVFIFSNYFKIFSLRLAHIFLVTNQEGILNRYEFSMDKGFCINRYKIFEKKKLFNIFIGDKIILLEKFENDEANKIIKTIKSNIDFYKNKKYNIKNFNCFSFVKDIFQKARIVSDSDNYLNKLK